MIRLFFSKRYDIPIDSYTHFALNDIELTIIMNDLDENVTRLQVDKGMGGMIDSTLSWPIAVLKVEIELHSTTVCGVTN